MRVSWQSILFSILFFFEGLFAFSSAYAAGKSNVPLDSVDIDLSDQPSLQRGAELFVNYCISCHSAEFMRYSRIGEDIGLTEQEVKARLILGSEKIGDTLVSAMGADDAKRWFGVTPPDLSVIARSRGTDWLYTYLRSFYLDPSKPTGTNNLIFKDTAMPHVMWQEQGYLNLDESGKLISKDAAKSAEFDTKMRDLVNFLAYIGEPSKIQRLALGKWVLLYLVIFFISASALKRAYWQDVH